MNEREEEIEKAAREMGDLSWQYFADKTARPTTLWRLLTVRTWKERQVPMSEWFDSESKAQERLAHHAANDEVETTGFDRYVLCSELAALRQQLAEKEKQLAEARAEVERQHMAVLSASIENYPAAKASLEGGICTMDDFMDQSFDDNLADLVALIGLEQINAKSQLAAQSAELERVRAHNETLVREHKAMAVEVSALHVEIENIRYAADVGLTEEANRADRWIGHARRLFRLKCEYSQKCREKDAKLELVRGAAEKSVAAFEHYQTTCREHRSPYIKENGRHGASPYAELIESCQDLRDALSPREKDDNP